MIGDERPSMLTIELNIIEDDFWEESEPASSDFFRYDVIYAATMHRELNSVAVSHFDERAGM